MREKYETDLTNEQWEVIKPLFVNMRNRKWDKRELVNAVLYLVNCQWHNLPHDFPLVYAQLLSKCAAQRLVGFNLEHFVKLTHQSRDCLWARSLPNT